jgi:MFS family permease
MVVGLVAVIGALSAVNVLEVFLVREVYGAPEALYGSINATWTVGMAIGAWVAAAVIGRMGRDGQLAMLLMTSLLGTGAVCTILGLPLPTVFLLVPLYFIGGICNSMQNSALGISIARRVPEHLRGRASARIGAIIHASTLGGFALGGFLSTFLGTRTSFLILGLFTIAAVGVCLPMVRAAARADDAAEPDRAAPVPAAAAAA